MEDFLVKTGHRAHSGHGARERALLLGMLYALCGKISAEEQEDMILITGATGQLGRAVVKQLAKRVAAERIGVFVRDKRKAAELKEQGVKLFVGNYDDIASLDQAMRGVERVLLISGTEQNRIQQHKNVVDAAQRA